MSVSALSAPASRRPAPPRRRATWTMLVLLAAALVGPAATAAGEPPVVERQRTHWYVLEIDGSRAGWMRAEEHVAPEDGTITMRTETQFRIARGGREIVLETASRFVETIDGEPEEMWMRQQLGTQPTESLYVWEDDGNIVLRSRQAGIETETDFGEISGDWLTPAAVARKVESALDAGAEEITVTTIDPSVGPTPIEITRRLVDDEVEIEIDGERVTVSKWSVTQSYMPGATSEEWLDADGDLVHGMTMLGPMKMTMRRSDEAAALAEGEAPELMMRTLIRPDRVIERPRETSRVVLDLRLPDEPMPELPSTGGQTVTRQEDGSLRVEVRTDPRAARREQLDEAEIARHLAASTWLDHDDPVVRRLAEESRPLVDAAGDDPLRRADALRAYVYRKIDRKALGVGFATASEVARTCTGDCSEHGVLLAALLRAHDIPARVVSGLVYADAFAGARSIFGYHMWTQALIDGRWIDFDATLPVRHDATHVAISTSDLGMRANLSQDLAALVPLMGRLEIDLVEVEHEPADAG